MDTIFIRDLSVRALIGTMEHERSAPQVLVFNIELEGDFSRAGHSDELADAVNYRTVEERIAALAENSSFRLLEALAEKTASECLSFDGVETVSVMIDKPAAALRAKSIAIRITRSKKGCRDV